MKRKIDTCCPLSDRKLEKTVKRQENERGMFFFIVFQMFKNPNVHPSSPMYTVPVGVGNKCSTLWPNHPFKRRILLCGAH